MASGGTGLGTGLPPACTYCTDRKSEWEVLDEAEPEAKKLKIDLNASRPGVQMARNGPQRTL